MTASSIQRNKRLLFLFCAILFVVIGVSGGLLNIAWTYMKDTFQVDVSAIGVLLIAATSGSLIAAFSSGTVIGRFGLGRVALGGMLVITIGFVTIAFTPLWGMLLIVIFFTYMGRGVLDASMNSFISENYGTTEMNWLHASWGIGLTIAPTVITFILVTLNRGWQVGYLVIAVITGLMALVVLMTLRLWDSVATDEDTPDKPKVVETRATARETIVRPVVILSALLCFVYGGLEIGTGQLVNTLFVEGRAVSQEVASLWLSLYWGSFTVGRIALGWIALRMSDRTLLRGSVVIALTGSILLMVRGIPTVSVIALLLMGSGMAGVIPTLMSQTPARVGKRFAAQAIGFEIGLAGFGGAFLPGIIGFIAGRFGLEYITYGLFVNAILVVILYETLRNRYPVKIA